MKTPDEPPPPEALGFAPAPVAPAAPEPPEPPSLLVVEAAPPALQAATRRPRRETRCCFMVDLTGGWGWSRR
jgi:hypothetical protein